MPIFMKKLLPFFIFLFFISGCTEAARQQQREAAELQKQADARDEFTTKLTHKFELPGSRRCVVTFRTEGKDNKTLRVDPCSLLEERGEKIDLYKVFDKETMQEVKRLGFTRMETERDGKTIYIPIE